LINQTKKIKQRETKQKKTKSATGPKNPWLVSVQKAEVDYGGKDLWKC